MRDEKKVVCEKGFIQKDLNHLKVVVAAVFLFFPDLL
jgi:hypothetical protein